MDTLSSSSSRVLWLQVWGLAAVQGAIALTWVIYNLYLRQLLVQFGFSSTLAAGLLILENLLAAVMEPLMGSLSDRTQQWVGGKFLFIAVGIILSATCFIAIPTLVVFGPRLEVVRWIMPVTLVAWALAMTVFRSPALSLLGRYAFKSNLPQAASILTLVGGVAGALGPLAGEFVLSLGPVVAFGIGSFVLLGAAAALRSVNPNQQIEPQLDTTQSLTPVQPSSPQPSFPQASFPQPSSPQLSIPALALIFGAGVGVGLGFRLLMQSFPAILNARGFAYPGLILGMIFITLAITAIPAGQLTLALGNRVAMMIGLTLMALCCTLMGLSHNAWIATGIAIAFGAAFSLVSNGTLPFALSMVPPHKAGLGTGMYFSGGAIANSVFGSFLAGSVLSPVVGGLLGAIAFIWAGVCIAATTKVRAGGDRAQFS